MCASGGSVVSHHSELHQWTRSEDGPTCCCAPLKSRWVAPEASRPGRQLGRLPGFVGLGCGSGGSPPVMPAMLPRCAAWATIGRSLGTGPSESPSPAMVIGGLLPLAFGSSAMNRFSCFDRSMRPEFRAAWYLASPCLPKRFLNSSSVRSPLSAVW